MAKNELDREQYITATHRQRAEILERIAIKQKESRAQNQHYWRREADLEWKIVHDRERMGF